MTMYLVHVAVPQAGQDHYVKNHALKEPMVLPAVASVSVKMVVTVIL